MAFLLQGERLQRLHRHRGCEPSFHPDFSGSSHFRAGQRSVPARVGICLPMPVCGTEDFAPTMYRHPRPPARSAPPAGTSVRGVLSAPSLPWSRRTGCVDRYQMPVEECGNMLIMLEQGRASWRRPRAGWKAVSFPVLDTGCSLQNTGRPLTQQLCTG